MLDLFEKYYEKYPNLVFEIMDYFSISEGIKDKSILKFCNRYSIDNNNGGHTFVIQPNIVKKICDKLCENNKMSCINKDSNLGLNDNYLCIINDKKRWNENKDYSKHYFNSIVYGNLYIYGYFKNKVLPIVVTDNLGNESIGTCFKLFSGIITAKHCLENLQNVSIKGYSSNFLNNKKIYISKNSAIDLAYIDTNENQTVWIDEPNILDDVLVLGYPKISGFVDFLTVEKALISSISENNIIPTSGKIAAIEMNIFAKIKLMLITAKIRGGNSGGPIISSNGSIVGVACQIPEFKGDYDDLGYGIAMPISYIKEIKVEQNEFKKVNFIDYKY